jgi:hypothetical protein
MIDTKNKPCPKCAASLAYNAAKCQSCGFVTTTGKIRVITSALIVALIAFVVIRAFVAGSAALP